MSENIQTKKLKDAQQHQFYPETSVESLVSSTSGGGGKFLTTNNLGGVSESTLGENDIILGVKQNGTPLTPVEGVVDVTVQGGESAYDLYVDSLPAGATPLSLEAWLASLKANIGEFLFVPTDAAAVTAMATIGQTYPSAIDPQGKNVAPSQNTLSVILLMNDDATTPSKTMMIATQETATAGTYEFVYAGDLQNAMPSNVLTEDDIDDSHLVNPVNTANPTKPVLAQAEDVMQLKQSIGSVDYKEYKVDTSTLTLKNYGVNGGSCELQSTSSVKHVEILCEGYDYIRFLGQTAALSSCVGYCFRDSNDNAIEGSCYPITTGSTNIQTEILAKVPSDAYKILITIYTPLVPFADFYCYLGKGQNVQSKVSEQLDILYTPEEMDKSSLATAPNSIKFGDNAVRWGASSDSRIVIPVSGGERFLIKNTSTSYDSVRYALLPKTESDQSHTINTDVNNLLSKAYTVFHGRERVFVVPEDIPENTVFTVNLYLGTQIFKYKSIKDQIFINESNIKEIEDGVGQTIMVSSDVVDMVDKSDFTNNPGIIKTVVSGQPRQWAPSNTGHQVIEIPEGVNKIRISTPKGYDCYYSLFKTYSYTEGADYPTTTYPTGWGTKTTVYVAANKIVDISTGDAKYLYLNKLKPSVYFIQSTGEPATKVTIYGGFNDYTKERISEVDNILQANSVSNLPRIFSDNVELPNSSQMQVLLQRASMMQNFKWTPKVADKIRKSYKPSQAVVFFDATEQTGIPYAGNMGLSVGFGISLYTFLTAVDNKFSFMYTENLQSVNSAWNVLDSETFGKVRHQPVNDHTNCWYGTYCNGFSARCTGIDVPIGCGAYNKVSKFFHIVSPVYNAYKDIRIGDVFSSSSAVHTRLVTGVSVQNGEVTSLTITEATGGAYKVIKTTYSGNGLQNYIDTLKNGGYEHFRVNDLYKNVEIGSEFEFDPGSYSELTEVCTFAGDKVTYLKGDMVVINFNLSESQTFSSTKPYLVLEKYNNNTEGWDLVISKALIDIDNTDYPTWSKYNSWAIEQEHLDSGLYRCYANEGQYQSNNFAEATYFDIVDSTNEVEKVSDDEYIITYKGSGELAGAYNGIIGTKDYTYYPLSDTEKDQQMFVFNPISFWLNWSAKYNGQNSFEVRLYIKGVYGLVRTNSINLI